MRLSCAACAAEDCRRGLRLPLDSPRAKTTHMLTVFSGGILVDMNAKCILHTHGMTGIVLMQPAMKIWVMMRLSCAACAAEDCILLPAPAAAAVPLEVRAPARAKTTHMLTAFSGRMLMDGNASCILQTHSIVLVQPAMKIWVMMRLSCAACAVEDRRRGAPVR